MVKKHLIKNFEKLATSPIRKVVLDIAEAGLESINTAKAVNKYVSYNGRKDILRVCGKKFALEKYERILCVGFGKAALEAVTELQKIINDRISCGFVIDLKEGNLGKIICRVGSHPHPTKINIDATKELLDMLSKCTEKDLVLCVVSGGGSALLCYPHEMNCETEVSIVSALTVKGAPIEELNTVRKHISNVKGGQLAAKMYPATVIGLIFSDVPGDDISTVASGPTAMDTTTVSDAAGILKKYDILAMCELPACKLIETPKEEKYFQNVHNFLLVSAKTALQAMKERAEEYGFKTFIYSNRFQGEAKSLGALVVQKNLPHECLLGAGESTVKIIGKGKGGRNQEMALAALPYLSEKQVFACIASDGHDNTDAAGAIVDRGTWLRAKNLNMKTEEYLQNNDSYSFFVATGDIVETGLTGANVSDFFVCINSKF